MAERNSLKSQAENSLTPDGKLISIDDGIAKVSRDDPVLLIDLAQSGKFKPVIGRSYPLEQMVEAHKYVETGHKKGSGSPKWCLTWCSTQTHHSNNR